MPSPAPTRLRQRKGVLKCELCGRKCLTPQALRTHQQTAHKSFKSAEIYSKKTIKDMNKPKEPLKRASMPQITVKMPDKLMPPKPPAKVNKSLNEGDLVARVLQEFGSDGGGSETDYSSDESEKVEVLKQQKVNTRKTEFECPKCKRKFAVYFSAYRHIRKHHSGLPKGEPIPPNLPITIKPKRIEICTICNSVLPGDSHVCLGPTKLANGLICSGCNQEFRTLALFDMHKSGMHSEGVESMFFPSLDEFQNWKLRMERQTEVEYSMLDQNDTKQVHRCAAQCAGADRGRPRLCPSSVIVQEFTKGFQVHYYPNHYEHAFEPYALSDAFQEYSIASLMNITASRLPDSDEDGEPDLYLQFKKAAELLVNEAARINVSGLKKLMRKALEMMTIVSSYVEDQDDDMTVQLSISPDREDMHEEVRTALRKFKDGMRKRKSVEVETPAKKKKMLQSTENTLKTQSKATSNKAGDVDTLNDSKHQSNKGSVTPTKGTPKNNGQSPSFIDTFQQFVGKIVKPAEKKKVESKKKQVVKTKMGQFKPSPTKKVSLSPKMESPSRNSIGSVKEIKYEVKEQENDCNILILKI